ncbi:MAG: ROK family protein [Deltaproteobacteria bacterium]|nr:ROK family protein [Deltaproteobacteria bacterium]
MNEFWGIDLGGTKIEGVIIDRNSPKHEILRQRIPTEADKGYHHIISRVSELFSQMQATSGGKTELIGIGTPGITDPESGLMKNCNTTSLNGMPLQQDLESALGCEVKIANDANCFALAEATLGVATGAPVVFGVIMGSGVGGGIVINGNVWTGHHGIAGEWGHNKLLHDGEPCYCGKRGCVETVISGPALENYYFRRSNKRLTLKSIAARAVEGDSDASATLNFLSESFAEAISYVVNILDPDAIVLGGGVSNIDLLYSSATENLKRHIFNDKVRCKILKHSLGDSAGVFGAAMLCAGNI